MELFADLSKLVSPWAHWMSREIVKIVQLFHDGMAGQVVSSSGGVTEAFEISGGVKQGCDPAHVFFDIFFTWMMSHAVSEIWR